MDTGRKMVLLMTKTDKMDTLSSPGHGEDIGNIDLVDNSNLVKNNFIVSTQNQKFVDKYE